MHAALARRYDMAKRLIDAGARLDITDAVGWTALHFAARGTSSAVAELIVEKLSSEGRAVDVPDSGGTTPLMVGASYNNAGTVELLIETGANFSAPDNTGRSAYEYASMKNASDSLNIIREAMEERGQADRQTKSQ
jgi:ankyrin repeat protein